MTHDPIVRAIQAVTGLDEVEALRKVIEMKDARIAFLAEQCARSWAETRRLHRAFDELSGIPCPLVEVHQFGACGRCGTRPDGSVG